MSTILSTLLLATAATAQVTTSIWMPSPYQESADTHIGFLASVVGVNDGKTTLALHFDNRTNLQTAGYMIDHKPNTMTFEANGFEAVSTESASSDQPASTVTYGCHTSAKSTGGVCSFVSDSPALYSSACRQNANTPEYCKSGSTVPVSARAHTYSIEKEDIATYQVVITAGTEKLSATAGATPSNSAPVPTGTGAFTLERGQNVVPTATGTTNAPVQPTGAAGLVLPIHPALAGLGAAAMAFLL